MYLLPKRGDLFIRLVNRNRFRVKTALVLQSDRRLVKGKRFDFAYGVVTLGPQKSGLVRLRLNRGARSTLARYRGVDSTLTGLVRADSGERRQSQWTFILCGP